MLEEKNVWNLHYQRKRSRLFVPDENFVRYVSRNFREGQMREGMLSLDLGTGPGRNRNFLQKMGIECIGLDFSLEAIADSSLSVQAYAHSLPFTSMIFDFVLIWGVVHYIDSIYINQLMKEVYRVLKQDARALFTIRAKNDTHLHKQQIGGDLKGGKSILYEKEQLPKLFYPLLIKKVGWIGRVPLGESDLIAHHVVEVSR